MALYAFDGTWDEWDPTRSLSNDDIARETVTNVVIMCQAYERAGGFVSYAAGVGTRLGILGDVAGGVLGIGASRRVREQMRRLRNRYATDPIIDVVGYSRGAATARMFLDEIAEDFDTIRDANGQPLTAPPPVRFVGLFDTVASFGIPLGNIEWFFQPKLPANVQAAFHAARHGRATRELRTGSHCLAVCCPPARRRVLVSRRTWRHRRKWLFSTVQ